MPQSRNWERKIADGPPCVVLASPGFVQSGTSRQFLEMWAPDPRNGIIITGYSIEGTMARVSGEELKYLEDAYCSPVASDIQDIVQGPDEITSLQGHQIPRRLSVDEYSFAAHVDFSQNSEFIELIKARHIVSDTCDTRIYYLSNPGLS